MRDLLAPANLERVRRFARGSVLLAFDFDGTLAPLVDVPSEARMREPTRALLTRLARLYPCAIITGRHRAGALGLLRGTGMRWVVGNHGMEWPGPGGEAARYRARVAGWRRALAAPLAALPGVMLEDKRYSLSVHVRHALQPRLARRAVAEAVAGLEGCRAEPGIEVVNLMPVGAPDKGRALARLLRESGCPRAIYAGDDVTDEAAFALDARKVLSVFVGTGRRSRAQYRLGAQQDVDELLRLLCAEREAREAAGGGPKRGKPGKPGKGGARRARAAGRARRR